MLPTQAKEQTIQSARRIKMIWELLLLVLIYIGLMFGGGGNVLLSSLHSSLQYPFAFILIKRHFAIQSQKKNPNVYRVPNKIQ